MIPAEAMLSSSDVVKVAVPDARVHVSVVGKAVNVVAVAMEVLESRARRMLDFIFGGDVVWWF